MALLCDKQRRNKITREFEFMVFKNTKLSAFRFVLLCGLSFLFVVPTGAVAEGLLFTPYLGYRVGGDFTDFNTNVELELAESESYGLIFGKDSDSNDS